MGCTSSAAVKTVKKNRDTSNDQNKSTILVFGMPDSGADVFVKTLEKCFHSVGGFNQPPFVFKAVATQRYARSDWPKEYEQSGRVVAAFFFADVSSEWQAIFSAKVYNWLRSQLTEEQAEPRIVACAKNAIELANFQFLKETLPPGSDPATFNEQQPGEIQKYVEYISGCAVRKAGINAQAQ